MYSDTVYVRRTEGDFGCPLPYSFDAGALGEAGNQVVFSFLDMGGWHPESASDPLPLLPNIHSPGIIRHTRPHLACYVDGYWDPKSRFWFWFFKTRFLCLIL